MCLCVVVRGGEVLFCRLSIRWKLVVESKRKISQNLVYLWSSCKISLQIVAVSFCLQYLRASYTLNLEHMFCKLLLSVQSTIIFRDSCRFVDAFFAWKPCKLQYFMQNIVKLYDIYRYLVFRMFQNLSKNVCQESILVHS